MLKHCSASPLVYIFRLAFHADTVDISCRGYPSRSLRRCSRNSLSCRREYRCVAKADQLWRSTEGIREKIGTRFILGTLSVVGWIALGDETGGDHHVEIHADSGVEWTLPAWENGRRLKTKNNRVYAAHFQSLESPKIPTPGSVVTLNGVHMEYTRIHSCIQADTSP
jgi:hypothetical protein